MNSAKWSLTVLALFAGVGLVALNTSPNGQSTSNDDLGMMYATLTYVKTLRKECFRLRYKVNRTRSSIVSSIAIAMIDLLFLVSSITSAMTNAMMDLLSFVGSITNMFGISTLELTLWITIFGADTLELPMRIAIFGFSLLATTQWTDHFGFRCWKRLSGRIISDFLRWKRCSG